jgi:hypothetical protein
MHALSRIRTQDFSIRGGEDISCLSATTVIGVEDVHRP